MSFLISWGFDFPYGMLETGGCQRPNGAPSQRSTRGHRMPDHSSLTESLVRPYSTQLQRIRSDRLVPLCFLRTLAQVSVTGQVPGTDLSLAKRSDMAPIPTNEPSSKHIRAAAVNHSTSSYTERALRSLSGRYSRTLDLSITVLDNASTDDSTELRAYAKAKRVPIVPAGYTVDTKWNSHGEGGLVAPFPARRIATQVMPRGST